MESVLQSKNNVFWLKRFFSSFPANFGSALTHPIIIIIIIIFKTDTHFSHFAIKYLCEFEIFFEITSAWGSGA